MDFIAGRRRDAPRGAIPHRARLGVPHRAQALLLLLAGAASACGPDSAAASVPAQEAPPRPVEFAEAEVALLPDVVSVSGTLAADDEVSLGSEVAGRLGTLAVDLGSRVQAGDLLARIDPTDFELRVRQAEAALEQARARLGLAPGDDQAAIDPENTALVRQARALLAEAAAQRERSKTLGEEALLSRAELDAAESNFLVAEGRLQDALEDVLTRKALLAQREAELELAREQLASTALRAPFAGGVSGRHASVGEFLSVGDPVLTLVATHPLRLRLSVPERAAAAVRAGQPVAVSVDGVPQVAAGRVARLSAALDTRTRTLAVEVQVPNEDGALLPGSFARGEIATSSERPVVLVPEGALINFAGLEKVIVVLDGAAVERRVRTGRRVGGRVEILQGLAAGERVVVGPGDLVAGQAVVATP